MPFSCSKGHFPVKEPVTTKNFPSQEHQIKRKGVYVGILFIFTKREKREKVIPLVWAVCYWLKAT